VRRSRSRGGEGGAENEKEKTGLRMGQQAIRGSSKDLAMAGKLRRGGRGRGKKKIRSCTKERGKGVAKQGDGGGMSWQGDRTQRDFPRGWWRGGVLK